ncbi:hypothetical protein JQM69_08165 [Faecalicatena contorta]|uniref:hypothetical protein n=1 Tax=Faecalicatena contorta TaxID=39482 RepID=UPI001F28A53F|nr:hypothetical protein [Faecalicatena contorta]MCF2680665.1 hypothetical protein [Faecalicatena contorta]
MKKWRQILAAILSATMLLSLCACGAKEEKETGTDAEVTEETEAAKEEDKIGFDVEEQTLIDADGIKIVAKGVSLIEMNGNYAIGLTITNNTDKDALVVFRGADTSLPLSEDSYTYVNGYQIDASVYSDVAAGETIEDELILPAFILEEIGISNIGEVEMAFSVTDENYDDILQEANAKCVLKTTLADEMDTELSEDMVKILDENNWQAYAKYLPADDASEHGYLLAVIRNNTEESAQFELRAVTVNDNLLQYELEGTETLIDGGDYCYENPGHAVVSCINLDKYTNTPDAADIATIQFALDVAGPDSGNWEGIKTLTTEAFSVK